MDKTGWLLTIIGWIATIAISILGAERTARTTTNKVIEASEKEFLTHNNKEDVKKAIELSQQFAEEIIPISTYLNLLFASIKDKSILQLPSKDADKCVFLEFDLEEAKDKYHINLERLSEKEMPLYKEIEKLDVSVFVSARQTLLLVSLRNIIENNDAIIKENNFDNKTIISIYMKEFVQIKMSLLNYLEYFSMYFCTDIAKSSTVYQSLHQLFRAVVCVLYFDICKTNWKVSDKYYTHIIELFTRWNKLYCENKGKEEQLLKELEASQNEIYESKKSKKKEILKVPDSYK